jgi:cell division protein DivIC
MTDDKDINQIPEPKKSFGQKLKGNVWFRIGKNKYILTVCFFLAWMMFFDNNNWVYLNKLTDEAHLKQSEKNWYKNQIKDSERKLNELSSDLKALEKFARETYYMKRSNEDVFVFFPNETKENGSTANE